MENGHDYNDEDKLLRGQEDANDESTFDDKLRKKKRETWLGVLEVEDEEKILMTKNFGDNQHKQQFIKNDAQGRERLLRGSSNKENKYSSMIKRPKSEFHDKVEQKSKNRRSFNMALSGHIDNIMMSIDERSESINQPYQTKEVDEVVNSPLPTTFQRVPLAFKGFLNSFVFDSRGCVAVSSRHAGIRFVIPPNRVDKPTRINCKLLRENKVTSTPVLCEGEGHVCRVIKMSTDAKAFKRPIMLEIPHFGSLKNHEREIMVMRSDDGNNWMEHSFTLDGRGTEEFRYIINDLDSAEQIFESPIVQICTLELPAYMALISRPKKDTKYIGHEGGMITSSVIPKVKVTFPLGAINKATTVGVQVLKVSHDDVSELEEHHHGSFAYSSIVSIEPRCRKFHQPILIEMPLPENVNFETQAEEKEYKSNLKLFCNLMGTFWTDVSDSTHIDIKNSVATFTSNVSARFCLVKLKNDGVHAQSLSKHLTTLFHQSSKLPLLARFAVFGKRKAPIENNESELNVLCVTERDESFNLQKSLGYRELACGPVVEVNEETPITVTISENFEVCNVNNSSVTNNYNVVPNNTATTTTTATIQPIIMCRGTFTNRTCIPLRVVDQEHPDKGSIRFSFSENKQRVDLKVRPGSRYSSYYDDCILSFTLPDTITGVDINHYRIEQCKPQLTQKDSADRSNKKLKLTYISEQLKSDWAKLAHLLNFNKSEINDIQSSYESPEEQALVFLQTWITRNDDNEADPTDLEVTLKQIGRYDLVTNGICVEDGDEDISLDETVGEVMMDDKKEDRYSYVRKKRICNDVVEDSNADNIADANSNEVIVISSTKPLSDTRLSDNESYVVAQNIGEGITIKEITKPSPIHDMNDFEVVENDDAIEFLTATMAHEVPTSTTTTTNLKNDVRYVNEAFDDRIDEQEVIIEKKPMSELYSHDEDGEDKSIIASSKNVLIATTIPPSTTMLTSTDPLYRDADGLSRDKNANVRRTVNEDVIIKEVVKPKTSYGVYNANYRDESFQVDDDDVYHHHHIRDDYHHHFPPSDSIQDSTSTADSYNVTTTENETIITDTLPSISNVVNKESIDFNNNVDINNEDDIEIQSITNQIKTFYVLDENTENQDAKIEEVTAKEEEIVSKDNVAVVDEVDYGNRSLLRVKKKDSVKLDADKDVVKVIKTSERCSIVHTGDDDVVVGSDVVVVEEVGDDVAQKNEMVNRPENVDSVVVQTYYGNDEDDNDRMERGEADKNVLLGHKLVDDDDNEKVQHGDLVYKEYDDGLVYKRYDDAIDEKVLTHDDDRYQNDKELMIVYDDKANDEDANKQTKDVNNERMMNVDGETFSDFYEDSTKVDKKIKIYDDNDNNDDGRDDVDDDDDDDIESFGRKIDGVVVERYSLDGKEKNDDEDVDRNNIIREDDGGNDNFSDVKKYEIDDEKVIIDGSGFEEEGIKFVLPLKSEKVLRDENYENDENVCEIKESNNVYEKLDFTRNIDEQEGVYSVIICKNNEFGKDDDDVGDGNDGAKNMEKYFQKEKKTFDDAVAEPNDVKNDKDQFNENVDDHMYNIIRDDDDDNVNTFIKYDVNSYELCDVKDVDKRKDYDDNVVVKEVDEYVMKGNDANDVVDDDAAPYSTVIKQKNGKVYVDVVDDNQMIKLVNDKGDDDDGGDACVEYVTIDNIVKNEKKIQSSIEKQNDDDDDNDDDDKENKYIEDRRKDDDGFGDVSERYYDEILNETDDGMTKHYVEVIDVNQEIANDNDNNDQEAKINDDDDDVISHNQKYIKADDDDVIGGYDDDDIRMEADDDDFRERYDNEDVGEVSQKKDKDDDKDDEDDDNMGIKNDSYNIKERGSDDNDDENIAQMNEYEYIRPEKHQNNYYQRIKQRDDDVNDADVDMIKPFDDSSRQINNNADDDNDKVTSSNIIVQEYKYILPRDDDDDNKGRNDDAHDDDNDHDHGDDYGVDIDDGDEKYPRIFGVNKSSDYIKMYDEDEGWISRKSELYVSREKKYDDDKQKYDDDVKQKYDDDQQKHDDDDNADQNRIIISENIIRYDDDGDNGDAHTKKIVIFDEYVYCNQLNTESVNEVENDYYEKKRISDDVCFKVIKNKNDNDDDGDDDDKDDHSDTEEMKDDDYLVPKRNDDDDDDDQGNRIHHKMTPDDDDEHVSRSYVDDINLTSQTLSIVNDDENTSCDNVNYKIKKSAVTVVEPGYEIDDVDNIIGNKDEESAKQLNIERSSDKVENELYVSCEKKYDDDKHRYDDNDDDNVKQKFDDDQQKYDDNDNADQNRIIISENIIRYDDGADNGNVHTKKIVSFNEYVYCDDHRDTEEMEDDGYLTPYNIKRSDDDDNRGNRIHYKMISDDDDDDDDDDENEKHDEHDSGSHVDDINVTNQILTIVNDDENTSCDNVNYKIKRSAVTVVEPGYEIDDSDNIKKDQESGKPLNDSNKVELELIENYFSDEKASVVTSDDHVYITMQRKVKNDDDIKIDDDVDDDTYGCNVCDDGNINRDATQDERSASKLANEPLIDHHEMYLHINTDKYLKE